MSSRRVDIDFAPALFLTKSADRDSVAAGGVIEYVVRCSNTGNATARGVRVRDDVARVITPTSSSRPFSEAGSVLTWNLGDLEAGAFVSFRLLVRVAEGAATGSSVINQVSAAAMATGLDGTPRTFVAQSPAATVIVIDPALTLVKAVQSGPAAPGRDDLLAYRLELTNSAAIAAGPVVLRDTLPEPLRLVSVEAEVPVAVSEQIVEARWPDVPAGSTVLLSILTRVDSIDTLPPLVVNRAWAETSTAVIPSNAVETTLRQDEPTDGELEQSARIFAGADVTIEVRDADADHRPTKIDTVAVRIANQRSGEAETVLLTETDVDAGVFVAAVETAHSPEAGENDDGLMLAVPTDQLVGTYSDLRTESGQPAQRLALTEVVATTISLRAYPDAIVANGTERAIFTATLADDEGRPLPDGTAVVWRTDAGAFTGTGVLVDETGRSVTTTAGGSGETRVTLTAPQLSRRDTLNVVASLAGFDSEPLAMQLLPGVIGVRVFDDERGAEVTAADPDLEVTVRVSGSTSTGASLSEDIDLDDNGVFVVDQLPAGDYTLDVAVVEINTHRLVFAGSLQQISVTADGTATPPQNSISGSLRGRSESSGGRYAGSIVELLVRATGVVVQEGVVDVDGGYQFHDLDPGAYDLRVVFDDGTVVTRPVPEPSEVVGTALVNTDILIDPFGIVFDVSNGEAVAGARVSLRMPDDTVLPLPGLNGTGAVPNEDNINPFTTGGDGRYAFLFGGNQVGAFGQPQSYAMAVHPVEGSAHLPRRLLLSVQPSRVGPVESTPITMRVSAADGLPLALPNSFALTTDDVVLADIETIALHVPLFARAAVLEFAKIAYRDTAAPGESVDFGLAVANTGNDTARAVTLTDSLGAGWEIEWTDRGNLTATNVVRWELGDVAPGRRDTLGLRARIIAPQPHGAVLTNLAHLSVGGGFPLRAEARVIVNSTPEWVLSKQALADSVTSGQEVAYRLDFSNEGTDVARGGTLIDTLAEALSVVSAEGAQIDGNIVRWPLEDVAVGGNGSRRLVARVGADLVPGSLVSNRAVVVTADGSVVAADSAHVFTRAPRMNLVKRALVDSVTQGDEVTFAIAVINEGETPVTSVTLVDSLPSGLSIVDRDDAVIPDAVIDSVTVRWQLDSLAAGAADTFRVTVEATAPALITNEARLLIATQTIATATATLNVRERPPLEVSLVADTPTLEAGAAITYTVHLRATAPIVGEVVVTDSLPSSLVYQTTHSGRQPDYDSDGHVLTWTVADLSPERPLSLTFTAAVADGLPPGESVAQNRVVAKLGDRQFMSERVETLVSVPFLRIEKSADVTVVEVGDFVEYRIRLHNTSAGADTLHSILINDWTPPGFRYAEGTAVLDGVPQQPDQPGSGLLLWSVPPLAGNGVSELIYRLVVGLEAPFGDGDNTVLVTARTAGGADQDAGPVTARVHVRPDLFSRGELILGRAWIDADRDGLFDYDEEPVPGITLLMEDGTRIIADRHGKFSVPEVRPGDHVLRVLKHTLSGLEPTALGSRSAGDPWSRFVTVPVGGSAKANFPFRRRPPEENPKGREP